MIMKTKVVPIRYTYKEVMEFLTCTKDDILFMGPSIMITLYMAELAASNNIRMFRVENNPDNFLLVGAISE